MRTTPTPNIPRQRRKIGHTAQLRNWETNHPSPTVFLLAQHERSPYVCAVALPGAYALAAQRFTAGLLTVESDTLSGLVADRYMIESVLGRGASATVYLAHDTKQDRQIALKILAQELGNAIGAQRFLQEIRITSRLQHPHILPIHDSGEWNGLLYYVLPFVSGESLRARLEREKQLPIEECVQLVCDVASALGHAHSKGVIHRDVKPENILLSDGHALIADFGIARTTEARGEERLTSSGLIVGTSQYMSPEQASGELEIDARSDIYSLGCVLYEMLAGVEPFTGPTVQAIIAQRFTHPPRPVTTFRNTVPPNLSAAVDRALAISPADRFQNMKEFAAALPSVAKSPSERRRPGRVIRDTFRSGKSKVAAGLAVAVIILAAAAVPMRNVSNKFFSSAPPLDSSLYVVIQGADAAGPAAKTTLAATDHIYQALQAWQVKLVSDVAVDDAIGKSGAPSSPPKAVDLARSLGAGRLIQLSRTADNATRIKLYDTHARADISSAMLPAIADSSDVSRALMLLLKDPHRPNTADGGDGMTRSFAAWRAYGLGHIALKEWQLKKSLLAFQDAVQRDPSFVPGRLWKAQVSMWDNPADSTSWARDAEFAAAQSGSLSPRDAMLARGLNALAQRNFSVACEQYRNLTKLDSLDFIGWFGLGECRSRNSSVVQSTSSPSGWVFRSSFRQAAADYMRAVRLDPGASIISYFQIRRILPVSPSKIRSGTDPRGVLAFAAYPSLGNDTIAFIPYPLKAFSTLAAPPSRNDALERNTRDVFEFASSWTQVDPRNPSAFEELALILEARAEISSDNSSRISASDAVKSALARTTDEKQRIQLGTTEVRLRLKRSEFASAARLADSILSQTTKASVTTDLMALSAFSGKADRMAREAARNAVWMPMGGRGLSIPPNLMATGSQVFARAALGLCNPDTDALQSRLADEMESYITPDNRDLARHRLTTRSHSMMVPCTNGASALLITLPEAALYRAQQAYARKNTILGRLILDSLTSRRKHMRPGDISLDQTYQEAWLKSALGDTAAAIKQLDLALNALPTLSASAMNEPAAAAALGRSMLLRAELALKSRDTKTAQQWRTSLEQLWTHADADVKATIGKLGGSGRPH